MVPRWTARSMVMTLLLGVAGCAQVGRTPGSNQVDHELHLAEYQPSASTPIPASLPDAPLDPQSTASELTGPQPVEACIGRALAENRKVQAAHANVLAMRARIPQVTALEDPMVSNTIFPIPAVAPQYSLMGYNPYNLMIAQQFPWCGTLRLRGEAAEDDVKVALAELAAAELDAVASVKRAYHDLAYNQQAESILIENRKFAGDVVEFARVRLKTGGSQQDVLRAEVALADLDRELIRVRQGIASARADLAQLLHIHPDSELQAVPGVRAADVPAEIDRLYQLAVAARPELSGRLAALARDERGIELARKKYYPNVTLGLSYMDMERRNAETPATASGFPNVGLFVGFTVPIYHRKLAAGVCEAQARVMADARLYEAERDATYREVKDLLTQCKAQRDILALFRSTILPRSEQAQSAAASDYRLGNVDFVTLITAWREVLQIQLQAAQVEAELAKALASLERAVGAQLNEHPISPSSTAPTLASPPPPPPPTPPPPAERIDEPEELRWGDVTRRSERPSSR